ncbi:hypothetical protein LSAT2_001693 [Lamellibrachia satsuma]|nr:hypothetical protein LSAT2_001693 [Lamellibrachia satsuma]
MAQIVTARASVVRGTTCPKFTSHCSPEVTPIKRSTGGICIIVPPFSIYASGFVVVQSEDLISHLLVLNPNKRLTAAQALNHPWVKGFATRHANLVEAQHEMRRLNARRRLRAASYAVVAFRTTPLSVMTVESKRLLIGGEENVAEQPKPSTSKSNTKAK